jgi:putative membrane protein
VTVSPVLAISNGLLAATQIGPLALLGGLYARRAHTLRQAGQPAPAWRQRCFYAGLIVIAAALLSLGAVSRELLFLQMIEHLLVGDVAALLLVLGLTGPLIAPLLAIGLFDRLRVLSNPLIAFPLWTIDLYAWHLPVFYQAALEHPGVHVLEHALLLGFGVNMWMCLFGPLPTPAWFGSRGKLAYILAVRLAGAALANVFLWSGTIFYSFYLYGDAVHHLSPLADQNLAGAAIMIEDSLLTIGLFYWLFVSTARESEERQDLLAFAARHGIALSDKRAARAVATGSGAELRGRLEVRARALGAFAGAQQPSPPPSQSQSPQEDLEQRTTG